MDQTRISWLLCRAETRRLVLLMAVAVTVVLGLSYLELPYENFLYSSVVSLESGTVSRIKESSAAETGSGMSGSAVSVNQAESDDDRVRAGNTTSTFLASQVKSSARNSTVPWVKELSAAETGSGMLGSAVSVRRAESNDDKIRARNTAFLESQVTSSGANATISQVKGSAAAESGSERSGSVAPVNRAESDDDRVPRASNATFHASKETTPGPKRFNNAKVLNNLGQRDLVDPAKIPNNSLRDVRDKPEASGSSRSDGSTNLWQLYQSKFPQNNKKEKRDPKGPPSVVIPITQMKNVLLKWHSSRNSPAPLWASKVDEELRSAKLQIKNAPLIKKDDSLYPPLFHNVSIFKRSYELMEKILKVYVYSEGDRPVFHQPEAMMDGIYASEGWFMKLMETSKRFVTKDPTKAHLFYLAFSSRVLQLKLYVRDSHKRRNLVRYLRNYVDVIRSKHPFWNRTSGSDHFFAACHDWAPAETRGPLLSCIRALCNADAGVDFAIGKDVSLPETKISSPENPYNNIGGDRPSKRPILAFFAGNLHGYVRKILLNHWSSRPDNPEMKIFNRIDHKSYVKYMKRSRFCVCAKGYEVNSPRVVESILYGCVPVILSDNFVPPFLEVLDWESFAVFVPEKEIPNLRKILLSIPVRRYVEMQKRVLKVQKHFMWHDGEPVRYDLFHMILHSVWYNRIFQSYI